MTLQSVKKTIGEIWKTWSMTKKGHQKCWAWKSKFLRKKRHSENLVSDIFSVPPNSAPALRLWPKGKDSIGPTRGRDSKLNRWKWLTDNWINEAETIIIHMQIMLTRTTVIHCVRMKSSTQQKVSQLVQNYKYLPEILNSITLTIFTRDH